MLCQVSSLFLLFSSASARSIHVGRQSGPTITLNYGTFQGISAFGMDGFFGIPFAQAE